MTDKTAAELAEEERLAAIARGDIVDDDDDAGDNDDDDVGDDESDDDESDGEGTAEGDSTDGDDETDDGEADADDGDDESDDGGEDDDAEGDDDDDKGKKPKAIMIPKARFDEAQRKAKKKADALQEKLDAHERGKAQEQTDTAIEELETELETLEDAWAAELLEGELEKSKVIQKQIRVKRKALTTKQLTQAGQQTGNAAVEQIRFEHQLARIEADYPQLNPDHEDVNNDLVNEVNALMDVYIAAGHTHSSALQKAVHYVVRDDDAPNTKDQDTERSKRGHKARKAVNKAAKKSPPNITKAGRDSDKGGKGDGLPDVTKMSPEQFAKLSEGELAKMRGDVLSDAEAA